MLRGSLSNLAEYTVSEGYKFMSWVTFRWFLLMSNLFSFQCSFVPKLNVVIKTKFEDNRGESENVSTRIYFFFGAILENPWPLKNWPENFGSFRQVICGKSAISFDEMKLGS